MSVKCSVCRLPIDPTNPTVTVFQRIVGWEKKAQSATRRGGSDIVLRERTDEFACNGCIDRMRAGIAVEQESLL